MIATEFTKNFDGLGPNRFKQVKREGKVYLYERRRLDGTFVGFEVFSAKPTPFFNESGASDGYPRVNSFGKTAWFCTTLDRAEARFAGLCGK